jgi:putative DNA methylase
MTRMIERWFPCREVSEAAAKGWGLGRTEKAVFTWFAARPPAQARAALLCSLLPWPEAEAEQERLQALVRRALTDDRSVRATIATAIVAGHPDGVRVLDPFSGRGMIPLEAARFGVSATGIELSPVATLASELLTVFPFTDWSGEPAIPFEPSSAASELLGSRRLLADVDAVLAEVGGRAKVSLRDVYTSEDGIYPWGYLWGVTLPCQECGRRFPLVGSLELRKPGRHSRADCGQSLRLVPIGESVEATVVPGPPVQAATLIASRGADGKKLKGKSAVCLFCGHVHPVAVHKRLAAEGRGQDRLLAVAEVGRDGGKVYRAPTDEEFEDLARASALLRTEVDFGPFLAAVPNERIPDNNGATIRPQLYGARTYGDLMCVRQTLTFVHLCRAVVEVSQELLANGSSHNYARALVGYAVANLVKKLRYSTRGATLYVANQQVDHIFVNEGAISFSYDFFETGLGGGAGTWDSLAASYRSVLGGVIGTGSEMPSTIMRGSATSLPFKNGRFTAVVTDPPYDSMVYYSDSSDLFYVWMKRALIAVAPDFLTTNDERGLQDKTEEIIVKEHGKSDSEHRNREHYDRNIARAFAEARRVVADDGVVTIVFGHGEPEVWQRLLAAISAADLVMTGSWPANTESGGQQGKANIETTLTMSCRPAAKNRPQGRKAQVEQEIRAEVKARVSQWDSWGLAPTDMLMAAAGPAMEIVGRYSAVLNSRAELVDISTFLPLARAAVQEALAVEIDHHPLETFDARTRFALWWVRLYGRETVAKSELRWQSLAASLDLPDVRNLVPDDEKGCRFVTAAKHKSALGAESAVIDVLLAMARAFGDGLQAVGDIVSQAGRDADDAYLWAAMAFLADRLPTGDTDVMAWSGILRNRGGVTNAAKAASATERSVVDANKQLKLL